MDKSTHEEHLFQPLQTNNKQYELAITFLTGYNGIFNVTNSNNKFFFKKALIDEDFIQITISAGAYEIESLVDENQRIITDQGHYTKANYPFRIEPNFSTLDSIVEIIPQRPIIGFVYDDNIGKRLAFNENILWEENELSHDQVENLSFDNIFIETDIAKGMIFRGKRSGIIFNFILDVPPA